MSKNNNFYYIKVYNISINIGKKIWVKNLKDEVLNVKNQNSSIDELFSFESPTLASLIKNDPSVIKNTNYIEINGIKFSNSNNIHSQGYLLAEIF